MYAIYYEMFCTQSITCCRVTNSPQVFVLPAVKITHIFLYSKEKTRKIKTKSSTRFPSMPGSPDKINLQDNTNQQQLYI